MTDGAPTGRDFIVGALNERSPAFSADGRWVAYTSTETGQSAVFVRSVGDPSGKFPVSPQGGSQPVWSPERQGALLPRTDAHDGGALPSLSGFSAGTPIPLFADKYDR